MSGCSTGRPWRWCPSEERPLLVVGTGGAAGKLDGRDGAALEQLQFLVAQADGLSLGGSRAETEVIAAAAIAIGVAETEVVGPGLQGEEQAAGDTEEMNVLSFHR